MFSDLRSKGLLMGPGTTVGGPRGGRAGTMKETTAIAETPPKAGEVGETPWRLLFSTPLPPSLSQGPPFTYTQLEAGEHKRLRH